MNQNQSKNTSLHWRRTKIIATLGPATNTTQMIEKLIKAGVNVFRLNMSHGNHEWHRDSFQLIRKTAAEMDLHVGILVDLCGPKIRAGQFKNGAITLTKSSTVIISCSKKIGDDGMIASQYTNLYKDVKKNDRILLDDGNLELRVEKMTGQEISCKVIHGGTLKDNKGMNLPDSVVSVSSFTTKDKKDVKVAMELGADFVALSFVRSEKDIRVLDNYMKKHGVQIPIIAKIEKPEAVADIDNIIMASYGIMIARGDLGIELPAEQVPLTQKNLIQKAQQLNKPVIVATQMLESMITSSRPTRAEVGDVANAALSGTDAVMLSAETSFGKHPVRAVKIMDRILREIEAHQWENNNFGTNGAKQSVTKTLTIRKAVSHAATSMAYDLKLQGIIVPTSSGTTAQVLSANRPSAPILGVSSKNEICRKLTLHWGVVPVKVAEEDTRNWKQLSTTVSRLCKLTKTGNTVLLVSGFNNDPNLSEPIMKVIKVQQ